jgi:hypothetical protein
VPWKRWARKATHPINLIEDIEVIPVLEHDCCNWSYLSDRHGSAYYPKAFICQIKFSLIVAKPLRRGTINWNRWELEYPARFSSMTSDMTRFLGRVGLSKRQGNADQLMPDYREPENSLCQLCMQMDGVPLFAPF